MPRIIDLNFILEHVRFFALHLTDIAFFFYICFASSLEFFLC